MIKKKKENTERTARRAVLEDLFQDYYGYRYSIYKINFFRGIVFGLGSVIGGTLVVAIVITVLGWFTDIPGGLGELVQFIVDAVRRSE